MAVEELEAVEAYEWCPSGNPLDVQPGTAVAFIAGESGRSQGYGYGDGWSILFGSSQGDISLSPGDWLVRLSNGVIAVEQERPEGAVVLGSEDVRQLYGFGQNTMSGRLARARLGLQEAF